VKSAERALTILELFSGRDKGLTFTDVAEELGYPRSSLHGLLRTLTARGWLRLDARTRRYSLGLRSWEVGNAYRPAAELARSAAPVLDRLDALFDGSLRVAVLDDGDTVDVATRTGRAGLRTAALATSAGKVLLAELDRTQRDRLVSAAVADVDGLYGALDEVRRRGWGSDEDDAEHANGLRTVAVPVRDRSGTVVAALEAAAPPRDLAPDRREEVLRTLRSGAEQISAMLGVAAG
jgi:DNA-binding IclR family transcriptional regulator